MFKRVDNNIDLANNEEKIAKYWDEIDAFQNSLNNRKDSKIFRYFESTMLERRKRFNRLDFLLALPHMVVFFLFDKGQHSTILH